MTLAALAALTWRSATAQKAIKNRIDRFMGSPFVRCHPFTSPSRP